MRLGPCNLCGYCERFGCFLYSKASPQTAILAILAERPNLEARTSAYVTRILQDSSKKRATGVVYVDQNGQELEQPADLVVLSAFQMHNVRLLLLSGIGTPYDPRTGNEVVGKNYAYQMSLAGAVIESYFAPNLRSEGAGSLRDWSEAELAQFMRTGANSRGIAFGSMSDVIIHSTQYMSDADARATAHYLKSLDSPARNGQSFAYDPSSGRALKRGDASSEGALVYLDNCAACHRPDGRGYERVFPALAGNPVVEAKSPDSVVSIILRGSTTPRTPHTPAQFTMTGFAWRLSDIQVMQAANLSAQIGGIEGQRVTLDDVARLHPGSH